MIKIPDDTKKFSVPNSSDLFGNIHYTKNINLDEEGYIKLSPRTVMLGSSEATSGLDTPYNYGRTTSGNFIVTDGDSQTNVALNATGPSITVRSGDTGYPGSDFYSSGKFWQGLWFTATNTKLYSVSSTTWTERFTGLASNVPWPIEPFINRKTLCIGSANTLYQINTSYSATTNLVIPSDYQIVNIAYNAGRMGIITKLATAGSNQDAFFFVWDGVTTEANIGVAIGSDWAVGIAPYKNSWVILTRTGQLKYFNGTGFDVLANLPIYSQDAMWCDFLNRSGFGENLHVDGDVIYINIASNISPRGKKLEYFYTGFNAGVWCYDPEIGLYHRYSPSYSLAGVLLVGTSGVNTGTGVITPTGTVPDTGTPVLLSSATGAVIGGLTLNTIYYVIKVDATTMKLATSKANALAGTSITLTSTGSNSNYFYSFNMIDYGIAYSSSQRAGGVAKFGDSSPYYTDIIFGGKYDNATQANTYGSYCYAFPGLENRGYFVTPKIFASEQTELLQGVHMKWRRLVDNDAIIVKVKQKEVTGLPVTDLQNASVGTGTFTASTTLTSTKDLSDAKTAYDAGDELEIEFLSGTGAGQMEKITGLTYNAGTYTITTENAVIGASNGKKCAFKIDHWTIIRTITASSNENLAGFLKFNVKKTGKFMKFKVELRGSNTTLEEFFINNDTHRKV